MKILRQREFSNGERNSIRKASQGNVMLGSPITLKNSGVRTRPRRSKAMKNNLVNPA